MRHPGPRMRRVKPTWRSPISTPCGRTSSASPTIPRPRQRLRERGRGRWRWWRWGWRWRPVVAQAVGQQPLARVGDGVEGRRFPEGSQQPAAPLVALAEGARNRWRGRGLGGRVFRPSAAKTPRSRAARAPRPGGSRRRPSARRPGCRRRGRSPAAAPSGASCARRGAARGRHDGDGRVGRGHRDLDGHRRRGRRRSSGALGALAPLLQKGEQRRAAIGRDGRSCSMASGLAFDHIARGGGRVALGRARRLDGLGKGGVARLLATAEDVEESRAGGGTAAARAPGRLGLGSGAGSGVGASPHRALVYTDSLREGFPRTRELARRRGCRRT